MHSPIYLKSPTPSSRPIAAPPSRPEPSSRQQQHHQQQHHQHHQQHQRQQQPLSPSVSTSMPTTPSQLTIEKLERLAVARLQHTVNELQTQVDHDRKLLPPTRKTFCYICDETALTASIPDLKRFVADKSITMVVPLVALDALDKLKKGSDDVNIHARESIRFLDRMQTPAGRKAITGVKIQDPSERYQKWADFVTALEISLPDDHQEPPPRIKDILNCAVYCLNHPGIPSAIDEIFLVTNNRLVKEWAIVYNVPVISPDDISGMIRSEDIEFTERKRHYDYAQSNNYSRSPSSPRRGGRGFGGGEGGSRGNFRERNETRTSSGGGGRRGRGGGSIVRDCSPPDFVLRGSPRGVARGRGKLWEP